MDKNKINTKMGKTFEWGSVIMFAGSGVGVFTHDVSQTVFFGIGALVFTLWAIFSYSKVKGD